MPTHTGGTCRAGAGLGEATGKSGPPRLVRLPRAIVDLPEPVVARVTGHARAGRLGLLGACGIPAAASARLFSSPEARERMTAFLEHRDPAWVR